jgi:hypothetical protein
MVSLRGRFLSFSSVGAMLLCVLLSSPAAAQSQPTIQRAGAEASVGFQGGVSIDPEQGFVGVFWESPQLGGRFSLRPGIDGGFGSDLRLATINIDFMARFPLGNSPWSLVSGGGPIIAFAKIPDLDASETSAGFGYLFGFAHDSGFFADFRLGSGDVPTLKIGAGYRLSY